MGRHTRVVSHDGQDKQPILQVLWSSGVWKLFPLVLIYSTGFAILFPVIPTMLTNGFASQAAGHFVDCQLFTPSTSPIECRNAHSQAVVWNSWTSFVSGSILSFICAPFTGRLSDHWGRKPFMFTGVLLALMPMIVLMFFTWGWVRIEWYYPISALNGMVSSFTACLTSVADLLHQAHRTTAIGYLSACFSIGILIGPMTGAYISTSAAVYVCIGFIILTLLYTVLVVPETAPRVLARRQARRTGLSGYGEDGEEGAEQLDEPLLHGAPSSSPSSPRASSAGNASSTRKLGEMDFDPIPNVVPHAHEHTLLHVSSPVCDGAAIVCDSTTATKRDVGAHGGVAGAAGAHCGLDGVAGSVRGDHNGVAGLDAPAGMARRGANWSRQKQTTTVCNDAGSVPCGASACDGGVGGKGKARKERCGGRQGLTRSCADMWVGWRVIKGSPYYRKLVVIFVIVSMTWEGAQDLLMQYLQLKLGFTTVDQAHLLVVVAACGLAIKVLALATLVRVLGEQWLLILGLGAYMIEDLLLAIVPTKPTALLAIAVGSLSCVCWPASVALQTRHADPHDMGAVQGALSGISSLATGLGPIGFAALFSAFSRSDSDLPYFPQIVWYLAAVLSLLAILLTSTLHWEEPKVAATGKQDESNPEHHHHVVVPTRDDDKVDGLIVTTGV